MTAVTDAVRTGAGEVQEVLPEPVMMMVKVNEVGWASRSGRTGEAKDLAIDELTQSLVSVGQIDPIIVITLPRADGKIQYEGVDGYRRCLATVAPDIDRLQALVYPSSCAGRADEIRAAAIVQSLPHSDVEKALMVGRLVDAELMRIDPAGGSYAERDAIARVADKINKPERFVNDYRYLTRLSRESRALLEAGRLTLSQARELATVADHELQDEIAAEAASNEGGGFGRDVGWVKRRCKEVRRNLKVIAWDPGVKFAGKPACVSCPSNTANDGGLYAHDMQEARHLAELAEERSGLGLCVNPKCFQHKAGAAEQARAELAKKAEAEARKVVKAGHFDDPAQTARTVVERERAKGGLAAGLKDTIAIRSAREVAEGVMRQGKPDEKAGETPAPPEQAKARKLDSVRTVEQKAQERFRDAKVHWQSEVRKAVFDEVAKRPGGMTLFAQMIDVCELNGLKAGYKGDDVEKKMAVKIQSPASQKLVEPLTRLKMLTEMDLSNTAAGEVLGMIAERERHDRLTHWFDEGLAFLDNAADCVVLFVLKAIDAEAGKAWAEKEPKLETFMAEAGVQEESEKRKAKSENGDESVQITNAQVQQIEDGLAEEWEQVKGKKKGKKGAVA